MRPLGTNFRSQAQAQQTGEAFLTLLELSYTGADTLYLVNNYQLVVSNGVTYTPFPFEFTLPNDSDSSRSASIVLDNIDRSIAEFVLGANTNAITLVAKLVMTSDIDTILVSHTFTLKNATVTRTTVKGDLKYMEYLQDAFPKMRKTPSKFPGIF